MAEQPKRKGAGGKMSRSETVTVRLDPKLRYLAELAARIHRRTLSSYIEWAVEQSLEAVDIHKAEYSNDEDISIKADAQALWDVDESERFIKLAIRYPELLNHEEQELWKQLLDSQLLEIARSRDKFGKVQWDAAILEDHVYPAVRRHWLALREAYEGGIFKQREWIDKIRHAMAEGRIYPPGVGKAPGPALANLADMDDDIPF